MKGNDKCSEKKPRQQDGPEMPKGKSDVKDSSSNGDAARVLRKRHTMKYNNTGSSRNNTVTKRSGPQAALVSMMGCLTNEFFPWIIGFHCLVYYCAPAILQMTSVFTGNEKALCHKTLLVMTNFRCKVQSNRHWDVQRAY